MAACPICKRETTETTGPDGIPILSCGGCLHRARWGRNPIVYTGRTIPADYPESRAMDQINFLKPNFKSDLRIFELGCAGGHLAAFIKAHLAVALYDGLEVSLDADRAEGILEHVFRQWPEISHARYDLVILSHVLEHLEDVHEVLAKLSALLAPGGCLFIEVPHGSGHPTLPFDTNPGHLHFFSAHSLTHLLALHGFDVKRIASDGFESVRYPDSLRVLARPHGVPQVSGHELSDRLDAGVKVVVWGAGGMATELLVPYFAADRIAFFVDKDPAKQGGELAGRPICGPAFLHTKKGLTVLISSLDYEAEIRREIASQYADSVMNVLGLRELLT